MGYGEARETGGPASDPSRPLCRDVTQLHSATIPCPIKWEHLTWKVSGRVSKMATWLGLVAHACDPNIPEAEAEVLSFQTRLKLIARLCSSNKHMDEECLALGRHTAGTCICLPKPHVSLTVTLSYRGPSA